MIDLVKALRSRATWETATGITEPHEHIDWMAADEITRLREENARLREALKPFATAANSNIDSNLNLLHAICSLTTDDFGRARAAIREGENRDG